MQDKYKKYLTKKHKITYSLVGAVVLLLLVAFLWQPTKTLQLSYSQTNCEDHFSLFPGAYKQSNSDKFTVALRGGSSLYSTKACIEMSKTPTKGSYNSSISFLGLHLFASKFVVKVPKAPVASVAVFDQPLSATLPLEIKLDQPDNTFSYQLKTIKGQADNQADSPAKPQLEGQTECQVDKTLIVCDMAPLKLQQGEDYNIQLMRSYKQATTVLADKAVSTLEAVELKKSSIKVGTVLYKKSRSFSLQMNKELDSAEAQLVAVAGKNRTPIESKTTIDGRKVTIKVDKHLSRRASFEIKLVSAIAKDGSTLGKEVKVPFKTSDGPVPVGANQAKTIQTNQAITVSFDQALLPGQDLSKFIKVKGAKASLSMAGQQVVVQLQQAPKCTNVSLTIVKGLKSQHGVASVTGMTYSFKTICYSLSTIGYSVQKRPINAYSFGSGSKTILFTGAIHGSEKSSKYTMDSLINNLNENSGNIPKDKKIVVVPLVNPDGFYATGRYNANKVNLNRNWPTSTWISDGKIGGKKPYTEPEVKALGALTQQLNPAFVATYHSQGNIVNSNDVGKSIGIGKSYAASLGYLYVSDAQTASALGGTVTGTYEDWLKERGTACILLELGDNYGNYFTSHQSAIWNMIKSY